MGSCACTPAEALGAALSPVRTTTSPHSWRTRIRRGSVQRTSTRLDAPGDSTALVPPFSNAAVTPTGRRGFSALPPRISSLRTATSAFPVFWSTSWPA